MSFEDATDPTNFADASFCEWLDDLDEETVEVNSQLQQFNGEWDSNNSGAGKLS